MNLKKFLTNLLPSGTCQISDYQTACISNAKENLIRTIEQNILPSVRSTPTKTLGSYSRMPITDYAKRAAQLMESGVTNMESYGRIEPSHETGSVDAFTAGVGDVTSQERGSGARYNAGKTKLEYVPLELWPYFGWVPDSFRSVYDLLVDFQRGDDSAIFNALTEATAWVPQACEVFHYGAHKYAAWNWAKGMKWSIPLACIGRHMRELALGRVADNESGLPHGGHIVCNLIMLAHFVDNYPEGDDRPVGIWGDDNNENTDSG